MTFPHDVTYFPPFPTLEVTLSTPAEGLTTDTLPARVDTGPDATFVPLEHLSQIGSVETTERCVSPSYPNLCRLPSH